jgi:hypothetical protein
MKMKQILIAYMVLASAALSSVAREEPPPNSIIVNILSPRGYSFAFASLRNDAVLTVKERIGAEMEIIASGQSGAWIAEARTPEDQVQIIITVYEAVAPETEPVGAEL